MEHKRKSINYPLSTACIERRLSVRELTKIHMLNTLADQC